MDRVATGASDESAARSLAAGGSSRPEGRARSDPASALGSRLRDLGDSGWSIVPIIGAALGAWYLVPMLLLVVATLAGCATEPPRRLSLMWLPQIDHTGTCALLKGATITPEGCVTRSATGCTIVTPAKRVSYDLMGAQVRECLR